MTPKLASRRMITQCIYGAFEPQQIIIELIARWRPRALPRPALPRSSSSTPLARRRSWARWTRLDHRDRPGPRLVARHAGTTARRADRAAHHGAPVHASTRSGPTRCMPSEYVKRQFHVSFQDDPVAVACAPHHRRARRSCGATTTRTPRARSAAARRSSRSSSQGVPADERAAMLGGTLGGLLGMTRETVRA